MNRMLQVCFIAILCLFSASCERSLDPNMLIGKWNYVKVENPYSPNPPDTVSSLEIKRNAPYIQLTAKGELTMMWGGKILSHGVYKVDKQNISYTETLADGKKRTFPFWVKKITATEITFETKEDDAIRVSAVKE